MQCNINSLIEHTLTLALYAHRTVVEFYVLDTTTDKPYLASYVVNKLDESSAFTKLNAEFSIVGIETKGTHHIVSSVPLIHFF